MVGGGAPTPLTKPSFERSKPTITTNLRRVTKQRGDAEHLPSVCYRFVIDLTKTSFLSVRLSGQGLLIIS